MNKPVILASGGGRSYGKTYLTLYVREKVADDMYKSAKSDTEKEFYRHELESIRAEISNTKGRKTMWVKGKPEKSGNYRVRYHGREGRDDYTTSGGGHWWNTGFLNDPEEVEYDPESFMEL